MIERQKTNDRMSMIVVHNGVVYLSGQVGVAHDPIADQTQQCLDKIDTLLAEAGTTRDNILQAEIWLTDMRDFDAMNAVWDAWVPEGEAPARACGGVGLAKPGLFVEITVIAAIDG